MAFDGILLSHLVSELQELRSGRINRLYQITPTDFLFNIRVRGQSIPLFVSIHPEYYRLNISNQKYENDKTVNNFTILLRKYLEGGIIKNLYQLESDRIVCLNVKKNNDLGDEMDINLYIELMGRHSNLILCKDNIIINAYKQVALFENQNRTVIPGAEYKFEFFKINPLKLSIDELKKIFERIHSPKDLTDCFLGTSTLLANACYNNYQIFSQMIHDYKPIIINGDKSYFYYTDLPYLDGKRTVFDTLSAALDEYFYQKSHSEQIKVKSHNLLHTIVNKITKQENKLQKLEDELKEALDCDMYRIKGELLYANLSQITPGLSQIKLFNYYTNEELIIELSPSLSPKKNAAKYYTIYNKKKNSLNFIPHQIEIAQDEIKYLRILETQVIVGDYDDIYDIQNELNPKEQKRKVKAKILSYSFPTYTIYVGKNNIQNSFLLKEIASSCDLWFHVKDAPSSHVILHGEVNEESIRTSAMLASYYSKLRYSSSVPVDYTLVKYLKHIPGKKNCFVSYTNQKTIYIDPDEQFIAKLTK